jgi:rare lipoprotein A
MWSTTRSHSRRLIPAALAIFAASSACSPRHPVSAPVHGAAPRSSPGVIQEQEGYATFVARSFHGRKSASGETFDERRLVAAHRALPFGSMVRVTNVRNGRSVTVRIVDRGPYGKNYREGTIIDLSRAAARRLRMIRDGQIPARLEILTLGEDR